MWYNFRKVKENIVRALETGLPSRDPSDKGGRKIVIFIWVDIRPYLHVYLFRALRGDRFNRYPSLFP